MGLLTIEGLGAVEGLGRDGTGLALVVAGCGLEALEALLPVAAFPAGESDGADGVTGGVGGVVVAGGDLLPESLLATGWVLATRQGQDALLSPKRPEQTGYEKLGVDFSAPYCFEIPMYAPIGGRASSVVK